MSQSKRPTPKGAVPPRGGKGKGKGAVPPRQGTKGKSLGRPSASRPEPAAAREQSASASGANRQQEWKQNRRVRSQRRQRNGIIAAVAAVVVIVAAIIIVKSFVGNGPSHSTAITNTAVVGQIEGVSVKEMVDAALASPTPQGQPSGAGVIPPGSISGPPSLGGAHPQIFYVGAEYCPYCAAERWPLVMALSKFGTFTGLQQTTSSSTDTNPNTPTFSFVTANFASPYLSFVAREQEDRLGKSLQKLTPQQTQLVEKYDAAPYVSAQSAGSIPFILFGSQYLVSGTEYDGSALSGMTMTEAADLLSTSATPNPQATGNAATSQAAKAVGGHLLGAICSITGNQPATVCSQVPPSLKPSGSSTGGQTSSGS